MTENEWRLIHEWARAEVNCCAAVRHSFEGDGFVWHGETEDECRERWAARERTAKSILRRVGREHVLYTL